jgi:tryptophan 2,3-dioxygenase
VDEPEPSVVGRDDPGGTPSPVYYHDYLRLGRLLDAQEPESDRLGIEAHDELLFIIVHQAYELWFKQILHELGRLQPALEAGEEPVAHAAFKRTLTILKVLVSQIDVLETMTPVSFQAFRHRLDTASGFQSLQFRELEYLLGRRRPGMLAHYGDAGRERLEALRLRPSLYDSFLRYLVVRGYEVPAEVLERDLAGPPPDHPEVQEILLQVYHHDPPVRDVCERMVDFDEGIQEWRYRHVKMVERTIGTRRGTGGSAGAEYLRTTLSPPLFPDLWTIRARL